MPSSSGPDVTAALDRTYAQLVVDHPDQTVSRNGTTHTNAHHDPDNGEEPASLSATPGGQGYWIFTNRGRTIAFGDAPFLGDVSDVKLNGPVLGSVATPSGKGYYMVASDGGIFAFDAPFRGSMGDQKLNKPVVGMVRYGDGYLMVGADGGIFNFSNLPFSGSLGDKPPASPVLAVAAVS